LSKKEKPTKPSVHDEISGFDIKVDQFGQLRTNMDIDKINQFLKENVTDKKLQANSEEE